jgi:hypothetical protein
MADLDQNLIVRIYHQDITYGGVEGHWGLFNAE